jgi:hypothetical protein
VSRPPPGEYGTLAFTTGRIDVAVRLIDLQGPLTDGVFQSDRRFADSTRLDVPGPFSKDGERVAFPSDQNGCEAFLVRVRLTRSRTSLTG